jgi:voltage-dependent potassium channel beta subunit
MKYRRVGKSGLKISEISLGSWLTYGKTVDKEQAFKCFETAIDNGINFFDSAEIYAKGKAEQLIGEFLERETVDRKHLVISSKVFWPMTEDINRWGLGRKNILTAIEESLERLNTDYVDIFYMHRYDHTTPLHETVDVINDLIREGKIRYWGTSMWTAAQLERVNAIAKEQKKYKPIVEQPIYNMFRRHIEVEIMKVAKTHGMGFTVWSPLAEGILTGKYNKGIPEGSRAANSERVKNDIKEDDLVKVRKLSEIAQSMNIKTSQLALAWILRRSEISAAIIGATKIEHILENIQASSIELSQETLDQVEMILNNSPKWPVGYKPNIYHQDNMR